MAWGVMAINVSSLSVLFVYPSSLDRMATFFQRNLYIYEWWSLYDFNNFKLSMIYGKNKIKSCKTWRIRLFITTQSYINVTYTLLFAVYIKPQFKMEFMNWWRLQLLISRFATDVRVGCVTVGKWPTKENV